MKKIMMVLLSLVMICGCSGGVAPFEPDHYLYEVTDTNGNKLYLAGGIGVGQKRIEPDGKFKEIYDQCGTIAVTIDYDFTEQDKQMNQEAMMTCPVMDDINDEKFLEIWEQLKKDYPLLNDDYLMYNVTVIWQNVIAQMSQELGYITNYSFDHVLFTNAKEDGKKIEEIVPFEIHATRMTESTEWTTFLLGCLIDREKKTTMYQDYVEKCISGEINEENTKDAFYQFNQVPEEYQTVGIQAEASLYEDTNMFMTLQALHVTLDDLVNKSQEYILKNDVLMGVHMAQLFNLIEQLETLGYQVKQIK